MGEPDPEWAPRRCACHALYKWHRCAALQCLHHGHAIFQPVVVGSPGRFKSDPGLAENLPRAVEAHDDRDVHRVCARERWRLPAAVQPFDGLLDGVDPRSSELAATDATTSVSTATT